MFDLLAWYRGLALVLFEASQEMGFCEFCAEQNAAVRNREAITERNMPRLDAGIDDDV